MKSIFQGKIFTIPNILSLFRLCLIPAIIWFYIGRGDTTTAVVLLGVSALSDIADGFIARRFGMISDLGKLLDPLADKLTQLAVIFCLMFRFPMMRWLFAVICAKELCVVVTGVLAIRSEGKVTGANWHGKVATALLYAAMALHLLWADMPPAVSSGLIGLCIAAIILSGILYLIRNFRGIRNGRTEK